MISNFRYLYGESGRVSLNEFKIDIVSSFENLNNKKLSDL